MITFWQCSWFRRDFYHWSSKDHTPRSKLKVLWGAIIILLLFIIHDWNKTSIRERTYVQSRYVITPKNGIVGKKEVSLFTMATETLGFTTRFEASFTLLILVYIDVISCQQFVLPFKAPSDCSAGEFFDISSLSCVKCGPNQRRSTTGRDPQTAVPQLLSR